MKTQLVFEIVSTEAYRASPYADLGEALARRSLAKMEEAIDGGKFAGRYWQSRYDGNAIAVQVDRNEQRVALALTSELPEETRQAPVKSTPFVLEVEVPTYTSKRGKRYGKGGVE